MCDHCGCQEIGPIARLSADHQRLLDLSGEVRCALSAGDEPAARRFFTELTALLGPHVRSEERGLFDVLRERGEYVSYLDRLEADHRRLDAAVRSAGAGWAQEVPAFLADLRAHIEAEEFGLFPAALATLDGVGWEAVDVAMG